MIIWLFSDLIFHLFSFACWRIEFLDSFFFLLIAILSFFNQWWQIITGIIYEKVVMWACDCERMVNYEWPNLSTNSKVYWSVHSAAFKATWIKLLKLSQFLLKHIVTILVRKTDYAFKAGLSLFHHWIYSTFNSVFITWLVLCSAILVLHFQVHQTLPYWNP